MNKRIIVAISLILCALFAGVISFIYLENVTDIIITTIENISNKYRSNEDYSEEYKKLTQIWSKHSVLFAVILKHSDADTIDRYFLLLEEADKNNDKEFFMLVLSQLDAFLLITVQGEAPRVENIF